jgi:FkbM family methyltransferase
MAALAFEARSRALGHRRIVTLGSESRLWASTRHYASVVVLHGNPPDWNEMLAWRRHLRPGDLFVDVGANIGLYTLWVAECGAEVISVEPDADALRALHENLSLNDYDVTVLPIALGARPGEFRMTRGLDVLNHLVMAEKGEPGHGRLSQTVAVETLDDVLGERTADGVKIDVEGAERFVLEGAERSLADHRIRLLQIEWNDMSERLLGEDRRPVAELLRRHGYRLRRPDRAGALQPVDDLGFGPDVFATPT